MPGSINRKVKSLSIFDDNGATRRVVGSLLVRGYSASEIARATGLAVGEVRVHMKAIERAQLRDTRRRIENESDR